MNTDQIDHAKIAEVFAAQRANRVALKRRSAEERIERLKALREVIARRIHEIDEALHLDLRKPRTGERNSEVGGTFAEIDMAITGLPDWMKPEVVEPSAHFAGNETYIQYEPRGGAAIRRVELPVRDGLLAADPDYCGRQCVHRQAE
jgi:aldehyde dehydrogenase (NAD+)